LAKEGSAMAVPVEFARVKYGIVAVNAGVTRKKWETAAKAFANIYRNWCIFKVQAGRVDMRLVKWTEIAILDLERAIANKHLEVALTKGAVVLNNLHKLENIINGTGRKTFVELNHNIAI
jgi:hypothetical protein